MNHYFKFLLLIMVFGLGPLACQKTYHVAPLPPKNTPTPFLTLTLTRTPTSTVTITPTITYTTSMTHTPTGTWTRTATPLATATPLPNGIYVAGVFARGIIDPGYASPVTAEVIMAWLAVDTLPESTAGITLTGPGVNVSVPYDGVTVVNGTTFALYQSSASWTYQPGQVYTLTVATSNGTVSGSAVAPGGITNASDGSQTSWAVEGNHDYLIVQQQPSALITYQVTPDVSSPQSIPLAAYSAPATYSLTTYCVNEVLGVPGAIAGSALVGMDTFITLYDFSGAPTPTRTPTPTFTRTFTYTRTLTPTNTITRTFTPTVTVTTMVTIAPVSFDCSSDSTAGFPVSGSVTLANFTRSFIPLCNGWMFIGDRTNNQVKLINVIANSVSMTYQLSAIPNEMAYDPANSYLYVGMESASSVARIHVDSGAVSNIPLSYPVTYLTMGPSGKVFCELINGPWWDVPVQLVDGVAGTAITTYTGLVEGFLGYDFAHNRLLRGQYNISSGPLLQYDFNNSTNALSAAATFNTNTFIWGFAVSPDGNHVASLEGYNIVDRDTTNFSNSYGSWSGDVRPQAGAFDPASQYFLTASSSSSPATLLVYSATTHALFRSYVIGNTGYGVNRVGFSRGGAIVFGSNQDFDRNCNVIYWRLFP